MVEVHIFANLEIISFANSREALVWVSYLFHSNLRRPFADDGSLYLFVIRRMCLYDTADNRGTYVSLIWRRCFYGYLIYFVQMNNAVFVVERGHAYLSLFRWRCFLDTVSIAIRI